MWQRVDVTNAKLLCPAHNVTPLPLRSQDHVTSSVQQLKAVICHKSDVGHDVFQSCSCLHNSDDASPVILGLTDVFAWIRETSWKFPCICSLYWRRKKLLKHAAGVVLPNMKETINT